jgi:hypothetical protein
LSSGFLLKDGHFPISQKNQPENPLFQNPIYDILKIVMNSIPTQDISSLFLLCGSPVGFDPAK